MIRSLNQLIEWRGKPSVIRCDNGPEFICHEFTHWAKQHGIRIEYIQPGKPQQNTYIKRHNKTIRHSWLSKNLFDTLKEAQEHATTWLCFIIIKGRKNEFSQIAIGKGLILYY